MKKIYNKDDRVLCLFGDTNYAKTSEPIQASYYLKSGIVIGKSKKEYCYDILFDNGFVCHYHYLWLRFCIKKPEYLN